MLLTNTVQKKLIKSTYLGGLKRNTCLLANSEINSMVLKQNKSRVNEMKTC